MVVSFESVDAAADFSITWFLITFLCFGRHRKDELSSHFNFILNLVN